MTGKKQIFLEIFSWEIVKRFLLVFMPLFIIIIAVTAAAYRFEAKSRISIAKANENNLVSLLMQTIANDFQSVVSDLMILSENQELRAFLKNGRAVHQRKLSEEFLLFSKRKGLYDQIRFLDEKGMEVVRINFNSGNPATVPGNRLQPKSKRYYFLDTFCLNRQEVFVSPLDLNIEQGRIEQPQKPMIRFGTPVFDSSGQKRGVILLNYFGAKMIRHLEKAHINSNGHLMLLNRDGFWLKGPVPAYEWGFMYGDEKRTFGNAFPEAWENISKTKSGQFHNTRGLFTFHTVHPLSEAQISSTGSGKPFEPSAFILSGKSYYWKIISHVPSNILNTASQEILNKLIFLGVFMLLFLMTGSLLLSRAMLRNRRLKEELKIQAITDPLTGAYNRRYFWQRAEEELRRCQRYGTPLSFLMLDIDNLKFINDTFGHHVGDDMLIALVDKSLAVLRETDVFSRIGGDEFAVILLGANERKALSFAERLRQSIEKLSVNSESETIHSTVSIGLTSAQKGDASLDKVMQQADRALYEAKNRGRNCVVQQNEERPEEVLAP